VGLLNNGKVNIFGELSFLIQQHVGSSCNEDEEWNRDVKVKQHLRSFLKVATDLLASIHRKSFLGAGDGAITFFPVVFPAKQQMNKEL
jgi:hypothetical protein